MRVFTGACCLVLAALGCAPKAPAFAQPPPGGGIPSPPPLAVDDAAPPPRDCVVRFSFPTQGTVGRYPSYQVQASPPIPYAGGGAEPTAVVTVTAPDGTRDQQVLPLVTPPVCAYCLPAPGSDGCEHDCHWEPFERTVESLQMRMPGRHHVLVRLQGTTCALEGGEAVLEAVLPAP